MTAERPIPEVFRRFALPVLAVLLTAPALACVLEAPQDPAPTPQEAKHQEELKRDVELGKKYAEQVEKELTLSKDEALIERVQRIGNELAQISREHYIPATWGDKRHNVFDYTFKVVEDEDVNAFSIPGGFIYVNTGLLKFVQSDDELAAVLAHEIAHAANRHLITLSKQQEQTQLFTLPVVIAALLAGSTRDANIALIGQDLLLTALTSGWSQEAETDADRTGFYYMTYSKYNPVALLTFMERLAFKERNAPRFDLGILRTHPPSRIRAEKLKALLKQNNIPIQRSKVTTDFRVQAIPEQEGVRLQFGEEYLFTLRGPNATERANEALPILNDFFDSVPQVFEVAALSNRLLGRGKTLILFEPQDDADGANAAALKAESNMKRALYRLAFRINW